MDSKTSIANRFLTLVGAMLSGVLIGYYWQRIADSGQVLMDRVVLTCLLTMVSFVFAFLVLDFWGQTKKRFGWVAAAVLGSVICAFNIKVIKFALDNWEYRRTNSISEYLVAQLPETVFRFAVTAPIFLMIALTIVGLVRLIGLRVMALFLTRAPIRE